MQEITQKASTRKRRLYILLLVCQMLIVFYPLLAGELIMQKYISMTIPQMGISHSLVVVLLIIVNILFVKEFIPKNWFYLFCLNNFISFVISTAAHSVPAVSGDPGLVRMFTIISDISVFITLFVTFFIAIKDMFLIRHDITYSLVGAANIYILIGSIFSFIIAICGAVFTGMVVPAEQIMELEVRASQLAYYNLASMDLPFENVNPFIKHILVLESIFAHLFVVIIIGRLLSK